MEALVTKLSSNKIREYDHSGKMYQIGYECKAVFILFSS